MIVTSIGRSQIKSITLPQKVKGQYWLYETVDNVDKKIVSIEGVGGQWTLKPTKKVKLLDSHNHALKSTVISPLNIYVLEKGNSDKEFVFTEPITADRQIFTKYLVKDDMTLSIGRTEGNDICYSNQVVSSKHAQLSFSSGRWSIQDINSTNGTFVNDMRISEVELKIGDVIFIMGLKIIIGKSFIALNNPDGSVAVSGKLQRFHHQVVDGNNEDDEDDDYEKNNAEYFSRSPRFKRDIETAEIKIDTPPQSPLSNEMPWLLVMGSSMAMGVMSLVTIASAITSKNITSLVMGGSMLLGTVLLPSISKKYERKQKEKKEKLRQKKYREYLDQISVKISEECQSQEVILRENFVDMNECIARIQNVSSNLWERTSTQNDFLKLRIGIGNSEPDIKLQYSERKFTLDEDNLQEELYSLCERKTELHDVPIVLSLYESYITGVIGDFDNRLRFAKNMIYQIASYYSYDEVKFIFLYDAADEDTFSFARWLPHVWNDDKSFRFVATNHDEVKGLSSYLERDIEYRSDKNEDELSDITPYYIVFSFSDKLSRNAEFLRQLYAEKANLNFSVINFCEEFKNLPKECNTVIELISEAEGRMFSNNGRSDNMISYRPDMYDHQNSVGLSKILANISLDVESEKYSLPKMLSFLDMYGVGKIEYLNPYTRWKENDPTRTLEAPVGVDTAGHLFKLDLHEKYHGPHGLVAGMTGSGKSEFIITYILSMAVNYHPDEVAFILIDYKGGGLAGAFLDNDRGIKLPHLAGTITNLDGPSITRSLISIQSELRHRQAVFNNARKLANEGTMDIYKYQKLYRRGLVKEPLPHLFIISDEFAELKTQQPEFMEQLISAARIGRSLGVHLILATQKPNGVVDDQIWSNSRFRVCLKVQEKADSMDMIKRPDAASLSDTGRFYLQVGFNEFFDMGQSAWCGAPYVPSEKVKETYDNSIKVIDTLGRTVSEVKPKEKGLTGAEVKQVVALVRFLSDIAQEESISVRPLWLEPIPEKIYITELEEKYRYVPKKYELNPVIGEYDDPFNQAQHVMTLPISKEGHCVVYGSTGSGVEQVLETMAYSLILHHSADELNMYMLDFGAETLNCFKKAPQVGDVLSSSDEEKVINLFKLLQQESNKRKKLFSEYGGNYSTYIARSGETLPNIVVVINNFPVFSELFENLEDQLTSLSRECQKYGIYFVITASASNGVRYRLQQNFGQVLVLQMNDTSDYVGILGQTEGIVPSKMSGRGIVRYDKVYEFQTALSYDTDDVTRYLREQSEFMLAAADTFARKIPILPEVVDLEFVEDNISNLSSVPVGVNKNNLQISSINLSSKVAYMVYAEALAMMPRFAHSIGDVINKTGVNTTVIDSQMSVTEGDYTLCNSDFDDVIVGIFNDMVERNNQYKAAGMDETVLDKFDEKVYIILGMKSLLESLSDDGADKLKVLIEKAAANYKIHFVILDEISAVSSYSFQTWYKTHVATNEGIWVGGGIYNQYTMRLNRASSSMEDIDSDFGYVVHRGKEVLVKLIDTCEMEDESYE